MTPDEANAAWGAIKLLHKGELNVVEGVLMRLIASGLVCEDVQFWARRFQQFLGRRVHVPSVPRYFCGFYEDLRCLRM